MSHRGLGRPGHRASRRWWLLAIALLLIGASALGIGLHGRLSSSDATASPPFTSSPTVAPSASTSTSATTSATHSSAVVTPAGVKVVARSVPVTLHIPAIKVSVSLSKLGLNPDGTVAVPTDFAQPGWFHLGPSPGQVGSSVILGHVHSSRGPAVFWNLGKLRVGDRIVVRLADGVIVRFAVMKVAAYPKQDFPSRLVYASHGHRDLQLVTCGGVYDKKNHRYLSDVVVYSRLV